MSWPYASTPSSWTFMVLSAGLMALSWTAWRARRVPGAYSFGWASLFAALCAISSAFETASTTPFTRTFWFVFGANWQLPTVTAVFCFVAEYAQPGRWVTRRTQALLSIPPVLATLLTLTNPLHHWFWRGFTPEGFSISGPVEVVFVAYAYVLWCMNLVIFGWLFVRSPVHRWPVVLMVFGQVGARLSFLLDYFGKHITPTLDTNVFTLGVWLGLNAIALFGFRIFDPVPFARAAAIEEMREGMIVTELSGNILYLNPTAEKILGLPAKRLRRQRVDTFLPAVGTAGDNPVEESEICLGAGESARYFALHRSPLSDRRCIPLGYLVLLQDITGRRRAQAELLQQQKVVSALQERQQLARELHDSLGQVLAYISMQAQAIRKRVQAGQTDSTESQLAQLAEAAQSAHQDIRDSILNLKTGPTGRWSFFSALRDHLAAYQQQYGTHVELSMPEGMTENDFEPGAGVQLLRVIQEALTNARKHGEAHRVQVSFTAADSQVRILIADDGCGFDPSAVGQQGNGHFGLNFMHERMATIRGWMDMESAPRAGTRILLYVPLKGNRGEGQS